MTLDILRRTGGWCVELQQPLKGHAGEITAIEIRKPNAELVIRWRNNQIPSLLAFLSQLCDVSEKLLRQMLADDFDRVVFAFMNVVPPTLREELTASGKPLATPDDELPASEHVPVPDQVDPRFPAVDGPVRRLAERPKPPPDPPPMNLTPPPVSEVVQ